MSVRLAVLSVLLCVMSSAACAGPRLELRLGEPARDPPQGISATSSTEGSDTLQCLREGEWSVGRVSVRSAGAPAPEASAERLPLRILGGAERAPVPTLVRPGERETYVRNAHREGADVVAAIPWPARGGEDRYELVDLSSSVEWTLEPALEADPRDRAPLGDRRALVLIPADDEPAAARRPRDAREARCLPFRVLRESPGYAALLAGTKPYLYRYPAYRGAASNAAALARLLRELSAPRVALVAHGNGADILRRAADNPAIKRRLSAALTLSESTPAALLGTLAGR